MPVPDLKSIQIEQMLLSSTDKEILYSNFSILIARILVKHMPFLSKFGSSVERHIRHIHSEEMSQKSEIVSNTIWYFVPYSDYN